ncbi:MAG TPA: hypothetical protein VGV57_13030 [Thermoleophilaceae bacterium]|nr:hypothetical protein [Thermoleophilaceae bacterium]
MSGGCRASDGSGGFAAARLLRARRDADIDLFERLPTAAEA